MIKVNVEGLRLKSKLAYGIYYYNGTLGKMIHSENHDANCQNRYSRMTRRGVLLRGDPFSPEVIIKRWHTMTKASVSSDRTWQSVDWARQRPAAWRVVVTSRILACLRDLPNLFNHLTCCYSTNNNSQQIDTTYY